MPIELEAAARTLAPLRSLTRWMDQAIRIPGSSIRLGFDALIGLIPGVGDLVGGVIATWFLVTGARLGAPPAVLARMGLNVAIDALVGAIPVLGDLFDVGWKANVRNLALLDEYLDDPRGVRRRLLAGIAGTAAGFSRGARPRAEDGDGGTRQPAAFARTRG